MSDKHSMRELVSAWLTGEDTCFLLGAGCSICAGKPDMLGLTATVLENSDKELRSQFDGLQTASSKPKTIEDLIDFLIGYNRLLISSPNFGGTSISAGDLETSLADIKKAIVEAVADDWVPNPVHEVFLRRLYRRNQRTPRDIFTLNYDTVLEASLDKLRYPYADGFQGANRAWFNETTYEDNGANLAFRIFKLHGSVNWSKDKEGFVRRGQYASKLATQEAVVLYPSEEKYVQSQFGVYKSLFDLFRDRLRSTKSNNTLVVLGYSFGDEHIVRALRDSITAKNSNLTIFAFIGPEQDKQTMQGQKQRLDDLYNQCDSRFNAFVGSGKSGYILGSVAGKEVEQAILHADLWKFENLVELIAGK